MSRTAILLQALSLIASTSVAVEVGAVAPRTFVASGGNDSNSCSLVSPCRSFSAALAQTAAGGEIVVLDSAGYGTVVIDKAVAITAPEGVYAGITVPLGIGAGVQVAAGTADDVLLHGLTIIGQQGGAGIKLTSVGLLTIDNCTIRGFAFGSFSTPLPASRPPPTPNPPPPIAAALQVSGTGRFLVRNSLFLRNDIAVMLGFNSGLQNAGTIEHSTLAENQSGINMLISTDLTVVDSLISGAGIATGAGLWATAGIAPASRIHFVRTSIQRFAWGIYASSGPVVNDVVVVDSDISQNDIGVLTNLGGNVSLSNTRVTHNNTGVYAPSFPVRTSGTNYFAENGTDGDPLQGPSGIK